MNAKDLEKWRHSDESMEQRLNNAENMLVSALALIDKQNAVVAAAREISDRGQGSHKLWRTLEALNSAPTAPLSVGR